MSDTEYIDYTSLLNNQDASYVKTWKDVYNPEISLPENFLNILKQSVYLPFNHYKLIAAYAFIPSALARVVPYLFLYGISGSGKSTIGKLITHLYGIKITSSSDTFAAIRNALDERKTKQIIVYSKHENDVIPMAKTVPVNTCMVWDDIDANTFLSNEQIYRLFKFGYDVTCDTIQISSINTGENMTFRCFCPKTFSSIHPIHLNENLKELRRRLIVVPTKKIEDISDERLAELGVNRDNWHSNILDIDSISWNGFSGLFHNFWSLELAQLYLENRRLLSTYLKGYTSAERAISIDLLNTGITSGIWSDEDEAIADVKAYWNWLRGEVKMGDSPLAQLLTDLVKTEEKNACFNGGIPSISNQLIRMSCDTWYTSGQLLERPSTKSIKMVMAELGYRLVIGGQWRKL